MPEHTTFFSYFIAMFPALGENMRMFGPSWLFASPISPHGIEPLVASLFVMVILIAIAYGIHDQLVDTKTSVIPETKLTTRTFFEIFIGFWYQTMKDMMGPKRAKRYFPLVGSLACFILFSNALGLIPGFSPPTSNLNVTFGCALVVFVMFNYYGIKENGFGYLKHLWGPDLGWVGWFTINPLLFVIETISMLIRPATLAVRLMLNMAVDHLLVTIAVGIFAFLVPIPVLVLSTLVVIIQVMVFCLLTSIYISLATEHEEHAPETKPHGAAVPAAAH